MTNLAKPPTSRYSRQERFAPVGPVGQERLAESAVLIVGCGALGSVSAETLVRAGVGRVRIVDRDFLELSNLQRQVLFDEEDVANRLPKAIAAAEKLRRINSEVQIEPVVVDITHENVTDLAAGAGVIVDGTDNFETRLLINDYAIQSSTPWVYGGCLGAEGQMLTILPGETACLTCLVPEPPAPGSMPTCDTAGILGSAVNVVASLQAIEAIKILTGSHDAANRKLTVIDLWQNRIRHVDLANLHQPGTCPTCHQRDFPWLRGERGSDTAVLCGRNAVQIRPSAPTRLDLPALAHRLAGAGEVINNPFLVRFAVDAYEITLFADGRAIVGGCDDLAEARSVLARYVGS